MSEKDFPTTLEMIERALLSMFERMEGIERRIDGLSSDIARGLSQEKPVDIVMPVIPQPKEPEPKNDTEGLLRGILEAIEKVANKAGRLPEPSIQQSKPRLIENRCPVCLSYNTGVPHEADKRVNHGKQCYDCGNAFIPLKYQL